MNFGSGVLFGGLLHQSFAHRNILSDLYIFLAFRKYLLLEFNINYIDALLPWVY